MKPHQLELGASAIPHSKTTHAVDRASKSKTIKESDTLYREEKLTTKEKFERRLKAMDYKFGFNYNTQKFPWPNNSFKVVYSKASLGNYDGNISHALKESYRVLKSGGILKFDVILSKPNLEKLKRALSTVGFINIRFRLGKSLIYKGVTKYDVTITANK
jgi:ubiquinone/menaquinone biosynthesis C-methylase UbiE